MADYCAPYLAILLASGTTDIADRSEVCEAITEAAEVAGIPPAELVAVGWVESRFSWPSNGHGPLQANPRLWPGDRIHAGATAYRYYTARCRDKWGAGCTVADVRCAYNMGWTGYLRTGVRGCEYSRRFRQ